MIGAVQYNIAATTGLADNFPRVYADWSANTYKWASIVMYTWGGGFFLIAGLCYVLLDLGIQGIWLGTHARYCQLQFVLLSALCPSMLVSTQTLVLWCTALHGRL